MDEKIIELMQERPLVIPRTLFKNYHKLNITEEELIVLIYIWDMGDKVVYNPEIIMNDLDMDKFKVMEIVNSLMEKKVINIVVEKNKVSKKSEEYIALDFLYHKLVNLVIEDKSVSNDDNGDVFTTFEQEFGRCLSPMEIEIIKDWINHHFSYELIIEALKEAIYNGVNNMRYIDKILFEWEKKGIKSKEDVMKDKERYHQEKKKKDKKELFDYNWLDDDE